MRLVQVSRFFYMYDMGASTCAVGTGGKVGRGAGDRYNDQRLQCSYSNRGNNMGFPSILSHNERHARKIPV